MSEPDLSAILRQAQAMQEQLQQAQADAAAAEVQGSASGGAVVITMTGSGDVRSVRIDPTYVDPADVEMLEDLIVAAFHDAQARVAELQAGAIGSIGLGGLGGGLGGLLGGGG